MGGKSIRQTTAEAEEMDATEHAKNIVIQALDNQIHRGMESLDSTMNQIRKTRSLVKPGQYNIKSIN
jgi:hypothetical protein